MPEMTPRPRRRRTRPKPAQDAAGDPASLTPGQLARLLTATGGRPVEEAAVRRHLDDGAPQNMGRVHLVHYAAWLVGRRGGAGRN